MLYKAGANLHKIDYVIQAQDMYEKALKYVTAHTEPALLFDLNIGMSKVFHYNKLPVPEMKTLGKALAIAEKNNDSLMIASANILLYQRLKDLNLLEEAVRRMHVIRKCVHLLSKEKQSKVYLELSMLKFKRNQIDSLLYFLNKTQEVCPEDRVLRTFCNGMRCYVEENDSSMIYFGEMIPYFNRTERVVLNRFVGDLLILKGKNDDALTFYKRHIQERDSLDLGNKEELVGKIQGLREYRSQKARVSKVAHRLALAELQIYRLLIAASFILIVAAVWYYHSKMKKNELKKRLMEAEHEKIRLNLQRQKDELQFMKEREENERLEKVHLQQKLDYYKRLNEITIPVLMQNRTQGGALHFSANDWKMVRDNTNACFDDFTGRLKEKYPQLSEEEIDFCCLVKMELPISLLSEIYHIAKGSISRKKMRLKEKVGVENQSFDEFIYQF